MSILAPLLPIFLLIALGTVLFKTGFLQDAFRKNLERFVYWVALPALLFFKLTQAPLTQGSLAADAGRMFTVGVAATFSAVAVATLYAKLARMPGRTAGTFVQASFRGNLAFTALPVVALAAQGDVLTNAKAALVLAPTVVLYNLIAVVALIAPQQKLSLALPFRLLKSVVTNPLILACTAGVLYPLALPPLPPFLHQSLELLGQTAPALALLCIGGAIVAYPVRQQAARAAPATAIKLAVSPLAAYAFATLFNVTGQDLRTVLIFAAAPTAVVSYVLATQLNGDKPLAAAAVVLATCLSCLSFAAALYFSA